MFNNLNPRHMEKLFYYIFAAFGIIAAVAIAFGAYWHIYTAGACWLLVHVLKQELKTNKNNKQ